jgi:hypothetical protein
MPDRALGCFPLLVRAARGLSGPPEASTLEIWREPFDWRNSEIKGLAQSQTVVARGKGFQPIRSTRFHYP